MEHNQVKNDLVVQMEEVKRLKRKEEALKTNQETTLKQLKMFGNNLGKILGLSEEK